MKHEAHLNPVEADDLPDLLKSTFFQGSHILNLLPAAVSVCDNAGRHVLYNRKAETIWGRAPRKNDPNELFSGAFKCYHPDGRPMPNNNTPMAACLSDGRSMSEVELLLERPDGTRLHVQMDVAPIKDELGNTLGVIASFQDISAQVQKREALSLKNSLLQDYVDHAPIGLHWVDANGTIIWANEAELRMLGYTPEEYIGRPISDFHMDPDTIQDILHRLTCNETLNSYESRLRCKDGSVRHVQISSNVYRDQDTFVHTRCFTVDVTEQKKLVDALRQSERQYRKLVDSLQTPIYTTDAEGRITLFNQAAVNLWGRTPEIGIEHWCGSYGIRRPDGSELPLDQCPMAITLREKRSLSGEEIIVVRPDGSQVNVAVFPQPLLNEDGEMTGAINMLLDITPAKEAQEALRKSEQRFRRLVTTLERRVHERTRELVQKNEELQMSEERYHKMVEEVEDYAIILLDPNGIIRNWNKGAEKIKGYKDYEAIGNPLEIFYLPDDRAAGLPRRLIGQARDTGKAIHEGWRRRKDGTAFWGSIVLTALHNDQNEIIGFSKVTRDLTERRQAEVKLQEYTRQLEFQNRELEQFAYAASHDMKEPLRKIHFYNSFISDRASAQLDERSRDYLDRSLRAVKRMNELIEDLLAYSRAGYTNEQHTRVALNELLDEIVQDQKEEFDHKKVVIEVAPLPEIEAVPFQVKQLMHNLLGNAVKYRHPDRDVHIWVTSEVVTASEVGDADPDGPDHYHRISVTDNGSGFDPAFSEKIFEIFQRLHNQSGARGSGIGLAICKKIIQHHKGFIRASGRVNEGARFDLYFPAT